MSRILRSTDIGRALRSRQRGFLLNPFRFAAAGGGGVTPSIVQSKVANVQGASSVVATFDSDVTVGSRIYVFAGNYDQSLVSNGTVTDSGSNTYTKLGSVSQGANGSSAAVWRAPVVTGGGSFAVTLAIASGQYTTMAIVEVADVDSEGTVGTDAASGSTASDDIAVTASANTLGLAMVCVAGAGSLTYTPGNGYAEVLAYNAQSYLNLAVASKAAASAGTDIDPSWGISASSPYAVVVVPLVGA